MEKAELQRNIELFANLNKVPVDKVKVLYKKELVKGKDYDGICRNAESALWDGKKFLYNRYKFGYWYLEEINHFEDDDGYDVFVPMIVEQ